MCSVRLLCVLQCCSVWKSCEVCSMWRSKFVGVAVYEGCNVCELWCVKVAVCGSCSLCE